MCREPKQMTAEAKADRLYDQAHQLKQAAEAKRKEAKRIETEAGLYPRCHLCGSRGKCGH